MRSLTSPRVCSFVTSALFIAGCSAAPEENNSSLMPSGSSSTTSQPTSGNTAGTPSGMNTSGGSGSSTGVPAMTMSGGGTTPTGTPSAMGTATTSGAMTSQASAQPSGMSTEVPPGSSTGVTPSSAPSDMPPPPDVDKNGKMNATPGTMTDVIQDYIRLGEIRVLNNNWGSEDLGCMPPKSTMSVFLSQDNSFGWTFNRGDCAGATDTSHPDFPQLEFGIHPFGIGSPLATSPEFTSTTLLPIQLKDLMSASVTLDNLNIALQNQSSWNIAMEFWLSERDPVNDPNPGVYAELMTWWGWDQGRWPCDLNGDNMVDYGDRVAAGSMEYTLCHQSDNWADGWRYYQFRAGDGSDGNIRTSFNGKVDVKALVNYLVNQRGYSQDLWLTRMEVGSEIDDDTSGTVSMRGVTFEVNGQNRSQVIGMP